MNYGQNINHRASLIYMIAHRFDKNSKFKLKTLRPMSNSFSTQVVDIQIPCVFISMESYNTKREVNRTSEKMSTTASLYDHMPALRRMNDEHMFSW